MFTWTDFSNLSNDTKVDITLASVNSWLQEIESSYYPYIEGYEDGSDSDFPYQLEWEFSESVIIQTYKHFDTQYSIDRGGRYESETIRTVAFGDFTYTSEGVLETARFSSWYSMALTKGEEEDGLILDDRLWGNSNIYDGLRITDINDVDQLKAIERFFDDSDSHDPYENHAFDDEEGSASDKGLGKEGILSSEAGKYFYDQWHVDPWGNNLIKGSVSSSSSGGSSESSSTDSASTSAYLRSDLVVASTWSDTVRINLEKTGSSSDSVIQAKQVDKSEYESGFVGSIVTGTSGDDIIRGLAGFDQLFGKAGDDLIHGGNGRDIIDGGSGSDELHGDFGWNTFLDQEDGAKDLIAIKSDQHLSNFWYGKAGNSPNGEKADFIEGLDATDEIKIIGVFTPDISVVDNVTARGVTGIGIYAKGTLEAVYTGGNLSTSQIQNMTTGDGSTAAMNNQMWSYWGDNTVPPLQA